MILLLTATLAAVELNDELWKRRMRRRCVKRLSQLLDDDLGIDTT